MTKPREKTGLGVGWGGETQEFHPEHGQSETAVDYPNRNVR